MGNPSFQSETTVETGEERVKIYYGWNTPYDLSHCVRRERLVGRTEFTVSVKCPLVYRPTRYLTHDPFMTSVLILDKYLVDDARSQHGRNGVVSECCLDSPLTVIRVKSILFWSQVLTFITRDSLCLMWRTVHLLDPNLGPNDLDLFRVHGSVNWFLHPELNVEPPTLLNPSLPVNSTPL